MKRSFAIAMLFVAVAAMSASAAGPNVNVTASTVAVWEFNEMAPGGVPADGAAVLDSGVVAGAHDGTIRVGQNGVDGDSNPILIQPVYAAPYLNPQSSLHLNAGYFNEPTDGMGPTYKQDHVIVAENAQDFDLMFGDLQDYTMEAWVKIPVAPYIGAPDEANQTHVGGTILCKRSHDEWVYNGGKGWSFRVNTGDPNTNPKAGVLALYIEGSTSPWPQYQNFTYPDLMGNTNICDDQWHHVAVVLDTNADPALTSATFYVDGVADGTTLLTNTVYNLSNPWINENITNTWDLWVGDQQGRWNDQFVGDMDAVAFSSAALAPGSFVLVPEPSSIVLLVMGALALLAIRRK